MTDVTTTDEPEPSAAEPDAAASADAAPTGEGGPPAAPAEPPVPFWQRPNVERYLVPLVLPIAVILFVVVYILNVSRIFLSGHGHIPIFVGSAILVTILLGATLLSAGAGTLRTSAIVLATVGFMMAITSAGWLVIGHAQAKKGEATVLPATLKVQPGQTFGIVAGPGGRFQFSPGALTAKTGLVKLKITPASGGHTFDFTDPIATLWPEHTLTGPTIGTAFFPTAGTYTFFCATPGHRAAGMEGTFTVTGPTKTLTQALTEAGNPATLPGS